MGISIEDIWICCGLRFGKKLLDQLIFLQLRVAECHLQCNASLLMWTIRKWSMLNLCVIKGSEFLEHELLFWECWFWCCAPRVCFVNTSNEFWNMWGFKTERNRGKQNRTLCGSSHLVRRNFSVREEMFEPRGDREVEDLQLVGMWNRVFPSYDTWIGYGLCLELR